MNLTALEIPLVCMAFWHICLHTPLWVEFLKHESLIMCGALGALVVLVQSNHEELAFSEVPRWGIVSVIL
jgi:hypothetical protein